MATLPPVTYFWRPVGAADDAWSEAPSGTFTPDLGTTVEVVSLGPSRARSIAVDTPPAAGTLADQELQAGTSGTIDAGAAFSGGNLVFSLLDAPAWAAIDAGTGVIAWTAPATAAPAGTWRVRATNAAGVAEAAFDVAVTEAPAALEWSPAGDIFPVKAYYAPATGEFSTDYDPADHAYAGPDVLHVDAAAGDDGTGDGSAGAPYATIGKAIAEAGSAQTRIEIAAGRYPEDLGTLTGKNLTLVGSGTVVVGAYLTSADLTWTDGTGASGPGGWRATPTTGSVHGMVDLTLDWHGFPSLAVRGSGEVEMQGIADAGLPGVWAGGSYAFLIASDRRDIRGEEDSTIVVIPSVGYEIGLAGSTVYVSGVNFVGVRIAADATSTFVADSCLIAASEGDHTDFDGATTILANCRVGGGGSKDGCDYTTGVAVELGCVIGPCGYTIGDNASTGHGSAVLSINSRFVGAARTVNDIGGGVRVIGGCTVGGLQLHNKINIMLGLPGDSDSMTMHIAGVSHDADSLTDLFVADGSSAVVYDDVSGWAVTTEGTGSVSAGTLPG